MTTRCAHYPTCREKPLWVPVISIPTYRVSPEGVETRSDKPTLLIGKGAFCTHHKDKWNLFDWFKQSEWRDVKVAAREAGFKVKDDDSFAHVTWRPLGWEPGRYLELERAQ